MGISRLALAAGLVALSLTGLGWKPVAHAAVALIDGCGSACSGPLDRVMARDELALFPLLGEAPERFEPAEDAAACTAARAADPAVYAIVLAPFYDHFVPLPGTQNDARLLTSLFEGRGVPAANVSVLDGNQVTRRKMIEAMRAVVPCLRDRDQVIVTFSGGATSYGKWRAPSPVALSDAICGADISTDGDLEAVCTASPDDLERDFEQARSRHNELVLFSSEARISVQPFGLLQAGDVVAGIRAAELSNFATQVRNRGADVIFILDTNFAEDFRLLDRQQAASFDTAWKWTRGDDADGIAAGAEAVDLYGSGSMAALYAASANEIATETRRTGQLALGELTFAISETLRSEPNPTILQMSREIDRTMAEKGVRQVPVFEATNPEMRFLATRSMPQHNPDDIDIIAPDLKRSAITPSVQNAEVAARYNGAGRAAFAAIDGVNVEIGEDGAFRRSVAVGERTEIPIRVYGRDASLLSERRLLFGQDETEAQLAVVGRRIALIIANDAYADLAFPPLANPIRDGEALAALLQQKFGYSVSLDLGGGKQRDLFLRNATKADIQKVLFDLRKRLTAEDQLLVYYAGHGQVDDEETAYWVPVDGEADADITWVRAFDITEEMRRISAGSVLLISDSCYAGGLSRSARSLREPDEPRDRYLANSSRFKARQLIASGGNEPVSDGGGEGHSLFARALLDALAEMPERVFTASELFEGKIKPKVVERAFASGSGQTPGHYRIANAGDEPSSEFIFRRK